MSSLGRNVQLKTSASLFVSKINAVTKLSMHIQYMVGSLTKSNLGLTKEEVGWSDVIDI